MNEFIDMRPSYRVVIGELDLMATIDKLDTLGVRWRDIKVVFAPLVGVIGPRWIVMWVPHES